MSYAVLKTGGKQYKVEEGQELLIERVSGEVGDKLELTEVLMTNKDGKVKVSAGKSTAKVKATIVDHILDKKVIIFKYKKRKRYRRKIGHRQPLTLIRVDKINFGRTAKAKETETEQE